MYARTDLSSGVLITVAKIVLARVVSTAGAAGAGGDNLHMTYSTCQPVWVVEVKENCLRGMDFLCAAGVKLDFRAHTVTFRDATPIVFCCSFTMGSPFCRKPSSTARQ